MLPYWIECNTRAALVLQCAWLRSLADLAVVMTSPLRAVGAPPSCAACTGTLQRLSTSVGARSYLRCTDCGLLALEMGGAGARATVPQGLALAVCRAGS